MRNHTPYPRWMITLELWASRRKSRRARELQHFLATLRLNSVIGGLLTSIMGQVQAGSFNVRLDRQGDDEDRHALRELAANVEHRQAALSTIELMVYNELQQRGLLHLVGEMGAEEHGQRSVEAARPLRYDVNNLRAGDPWTKPQPGEPRPTRVLVVAPASAPSLSSTGPRDADYVIDSQGVVRKDREGTWKIGSRVDLGAVIALLSGEWHVDVKRLG